MIFGVTALTAFENISAFLAKHTVSFYAFDNIRSDLENLVNRVALPHLGSFATPIVARELANIFSVPVTCFYAEMISIAVKEAIEAIVEFVSDHFGCAKPKGMAPFMREQALAVAGFVAGFLAKSYFCNFAMNSVYQGCHVMIRHIVQICALPFPFSSVMPFFAVIAAPYVTFAIGDLVWTIVSESTQEVLDNALDIIGC